MKVIIQIATAMCSKSGKPRSFVCIRRLYWQGFEIGMSGLENITPQIIERLYDEATALSDEVRDVFTEYARKLGLNGNDTLTAAFKAEALRATSRMMGITAWLLTHRANFKGEISEAQRKRCSLLIADALPSAHGGSYLLPQDLRALIRATEEFHLRLLRLEYGAPELAAYGHSPVLGMVGNLEALVTGPGRTDAPAVRPG